jgi:hypothetical protein
MGRTGFEPAKAVPTDLQSAPFDHSGTSPDQLILRDFRIVVLQKFSTFFLIFLKKFQEMPKTL